MRGKSEGEWINVDNELPPEDGTYEITNWPEQEKDWCMRQFTSTAYYDGWGFMWGGVYRSPQYWRLYTPAEKKYGKVSNG